MNCRVEYLMQGGEGEAHLMVLRVYFCFSAQRLLLVGLRDTICGAKD